MKSHNLQKITPYDVVGLFNKAYMRVASFEERVTCFRSIGLFPLNSEKFKDEDFIVVCSEAVCIKYVSSNIINLVQIDVVNYQINVNDLQPIILKSDLLGEPSM